MADEQGFVDTGDVVERRGDRYYFLGRRNGVINVGGMKVYPEEVEAVINRHPAVRMSRVRSRKNPIIGALVAAEIVLKEGHDSRTPQRGSRNLPAKPGAAQGSRDHSLCAGAGSCGGGKATSSPC